MYDDLQADWSPFASTKKRFMKDIFFYAAVLGYSLNKIKPLKKKASNIPLSAFKEEEKWILKSLIINEKGLDILLDEGELFSIIEEFANGGLDELYKIIFDSQGDPELGLEEIMRGYITKKMTEIEE